MLLPVKPGKSSGAEVRLQPGTFYGEPPSPVLRYAQQGSRWRLGPLPPMQETEMELLAPGFSPSPGCWREVRE